MIHPTRPEEDGPSARGSATSRNNDPSLIDPSRPMKLFRPLAVLFVLFTLGGCAAATGQGQVPYAPYSPENMHDRGGDGGGGMM